MSPRKQRIEDVVRTTSEAVRTAVAARDKAIVDMRAEGFTHRAIAEAADMSHTAVQHILRRDGADHVAS